MKWYQVGGCIRDRLLGLDPKDVDWVVTGSCAEEMLDLGFKCVGKDFPVFLNDKGVEFALARRESLTGKNVFEFDTAGVTLKEDLGRRDLTINAIAQDKEGNLIDPFYGKKDVENKILRPVNRLTFIEDPLRAFRAARFAAKLPEFEVYHGLKEVCKCISQFLQCDRTKISPERIKQETDKALLSEKPSRYFRFLQEVGLLHHMSPLLHSMVGCEHQSPHHLEGDVFEHTMRCIDATAKFKDLELQYMVLFHDVFKPHAKVFEKGRHNFGTHYKFDRYCHHLHTCPFTKLMPKKTKGVIRQSIINHQFFFKINNMKATTVVKKITHNSFPSTKEGIEKLILVHHADNEGRISAQPKSFKITDPRKLTHLILAIQELKLPRETWQTYSLATCKNLLHSNRVEIWKQEFNPSWVEIKDL